mgnify:CR=1 FL=1|jgi:Na+-transporting methylmalonyl-CoA/oxaloacetate decarboxylase beta subunit
MKNNELKIMGTRFTYLIIIICILLFIGEFVFHRHGETIIEDYLFFPAIFGFIAFIFIVFAGVLLRKIVMRKEDYYDD